MIFVQTKTVKVLFMMKGQRLLKTVPIGRLLVFHSSVAEDSGLPKCSKWICYRHRIPKTAPQYKHESARFVLE
jgi:hypothetical protein